MFCRRKTEEIEVELTTKETMIIPVRELTMSEMDDYLEVEGKIYEKITKEQKNPSAKLLAKMQSKNPYKIIKHIAIDSFVDALRHAEPRWRIITGMEDVSFIHKAFISTLETLEERFVEINPPLKAIKKNLQQIADTTTILENFRAEIREETIQDLQAQKHQENQNESPTPEI